MAKKIAKTGGKVSKSVKKVGATKAAAKATQPKGTVPFSSGRKSGQSPRKAEPVVSHDVYFTLKDNSAKARKKFVELGRKYLTDHPGTLWFAMGSPVDEMKRDVNDRNFDVGLHLGFVSLAALGEYAVSERHQTFLKLTRESWKNVRVFDSYSGE